MKLERVTLDTPGFALDEAVFLAKFAGELGLNENHTPTVGLYQTKDGVYFFVGPSASKKIQPIFGHKFSSRAQVEEWLREECVFILR